MAWLVSAYRNGTSTWRFLPATSTKSVHFPSDRVEPGVNFRTCKWKRMVGNWFSFKVARKSLFINALPQSMDETSTSMGAPENATQAGFS
jgi:hypothetical protein